MFSWKKEMTRLEVPVGRVLKLMQSMSDVQVALPGLTGQMATAYLCAYAGQRGVRVAVALHLRENHQLAFYLNDGGEVARDKVGGPLKDGIRFAESMGFQLDEIDLQQLGEAERTARWASLPLGRGLAPLQRPAAAPAQKPAASSAIAPSPEAAEELVAPPTPAEMAEKRAGLLENLGRFLASL
ncbi:hypothetical protein DESUT3_26250 [Desulfuromonas versatilis]|uniref:Uncharacterized protein n=1 Tax=Desulfuromonas versatilis TaxID=2802975 RepID=A0ABN6DZW3_9BACT|nr:hypothetical protein [Desulfuromonas versatilis]BCR05556.1 hypothetical protein DESUT3_26250 [Desulfuromonas versatilis]